MNKVKIIEHFYSIQGEGLYTGTPVHFIRFAGCNQNPPCKWCDTVNSIIDKEAKEVEVNFLVTEVSTSPSNIVVITGGEPTLQKKALINITSKLQDRGMQVHIETNGTNYYHELNILDLVTLSPKLPSSGTELLNAKHLNQFKGVRKELKFVILDIEDLKSCIGLIKSLYDLDFIWKSTPIYLTPVWEGNIETYREKGNWLANKVLFEEGGVREFFTKDVVALYLGTQLHKIFKIQ